MEMLKKGIAFGLGAHDMNKKEIEDFAHKLYETKVISKNNKKDLIESILKRKSAVNQHIESKIENYIRVLIKKEQLATQDHISYLEKRIDFLEEEVYNLLLDKYLDSMEDKEIEALLKDLDTLPQPKTTKKKLVPDDLFLEEDYNTKDLFFDGVDENLSRHIEEIDEEDLELDDLLSLSREGEKKMAKKKKAAKKKKK